LRPHAAADYRRAMPLLVLILLVLLAVPASAAAQAPPLLLTPAQGAELPRSGGVTFEVQADPAVTAVRIGLATQGRNLGEYAAERTGDVWRATLPLTRPGRYVWAAWASGPDGEEMSLGAQDFTVIVAAADRRRGPIPPRFGGRRNRAPLLISSRGIPASVPKARFASLVRSTARRWGLRPGGWTTRRAGAVDGVPVVGFARRLPHRRTLGAVRRAVRLRVSGGRVVARELVDRDLMLRRDVRWWSGEAHPPLDRYDLESVLVHELGHFAGNSRHARRCSGSPLSRSIGDGEWWRTPRDWWMDGCVEWPETVTSA
jgi:hypothetical protein